MANLPPGQARIFAFFKTYCETNGCPPSFREMMTAFGITSANAISDHLNALVTKGGLRIHAVPKHKNRYVLAPAYRQSP